MRIQVLSDLHTEFGGFRLETGDAEIVVIAGDIRPMGLAVNWFSTFCRSNVPVLFVPGNQDYWADSRTFEDSRETMRSFCAENGIIFLDRDEYVFGGVRFLGATLWTDFALSGNPALALWDARRRLRDFAMIPGFRPDTWLREHYLSRTWLGSKLAEPFEGRTVVVTHHAPSLLSLAGHSSALSSCFASDLQDLLDGRADLWLHGHTHKSVDYMYGGTRVVSNPRGYAGLEPNAVFDPTLVLTL